MHEGVEFDALTLSFRAKSRNLLSSDRNKSRLTAEEFRQGFDRRSYPTLFSM